MWLRGIDFGNVLDASGVRGFFGEGYRHHRFLRPFGLCFRGATFVAKTTTLLSRPGNMPLREDYTPQAFKPACVVVRPLNGVVLNAVGLSGPGAATLLATGRWQARTEPLFLSFMSVATTLEERLAELRAFVQLLGPALKDFSAPVGLQVNLTCPNVGLHTASLASEGIQALDIASELNIPLMPKLNTEVPVAVGARIAAHPACDALCVSNTIPWALFPEAERLRYFGTTTSPLVRLGGGGVSGKPLLSRVAQWVCDARVAGVTKPINAGGGILRSQDVDALVLGPGASSIFLGSIAILRPWRVQRTIRYANALFAQLASQQTHAAEGAAAS